MGVEGAVRGAGGGTEGWSMEAGGRFLRVIVNRHVAPARVVTVFFDRRLRREA
jgi:hypothetical protein